MLSLFCTRQSDIFVVFYIIYDIILIEVNYYIMGKYNFNKIRKTVSRIRSSSPEDYRDTFINPKTNFTRSRSIRLGDIFLLGLLNSGVSMNSQLRSYFGCGKRPQASAYIQQRDKLTERTYRRLFDSIADWHEVQWTLIKDKYLVVACDGSDVCIHPDSDDIDTSLILSNNPHGRQCNQIHLNLLSTCPDGLFIDYVVQGCRSQNEIAACAQMMKRLAGHLHHKHIIITCDRGYESYFLMMLASSLGLKFCIRLKDITSLAGISMRYAEFCDAAGNIDIIVRRKYTRTFKITKDPFVGREYIYVPKNNINPFVPAPANHNGRPFKGEQTKIAFYEYEFRLVRLEVEEGSYEVLATNLSQDEFSSEDLKELYHMRWGIETAIRQLKYDDNLRFIHTHKKTAAIGEIILSLIFHNICVLSILVLSPRLKKTLGLRNRKYAYASSYSDMVDIMRTFSSSYREVRLR